MNLPERIKMVKAMEFIARQINDEDILMHWLTCGVADGDLKYGDFSVNTDADTIDAAGDYCDDDYFSELMQTFLVCMQAAAKSGGLYCDDVVSDFHDEPMQ